MFEAKYKPSQKEGGQQFEQDILDTARRMKLSPDALRNPDVKNYVGLLAKRASLQKEEAVLLAKMENDFLNHRVTSGVTPDMREALNAVEHFDRAGMMILEEPQNRDGIRSYVKGKVFNAIAQYFKGEQRSDDVMADAPQLKDPK